MDKSPPTISFSGRLDTSRYPEIVQRFVDCPEGDCVVVDLSETRHVEPTFMGELLLFNRRMTKEGRTIVIVAKGDVARRLVLAGLDRRIRIVSNRDAAAMLLA